MPNNLEAKKLLIIRIMQILEYYSDANHPLTQEEIIKKLYDDYGIEAERKAIGRNVALLQDMFERDATNKNATAIVIESSKRKGAFLDKRLFEDSELRLLIDSVLASKHISERYSKDLIDKLSSLSNKYFKSNVKHVYSVKDWDKTENKALFWNIEIIDEAIEKSRQITFDYNKYRADKKLHISSSHTASPYQLMAIDCDEGFMILNGATRGTMANIERLIALGKECAAAILEKNSDSPENYNVSFQTIINERHFDQLKDYFEKINNR